MKILLDMDGVLTDFFTPALKKLNEYTNKNISEVEYVKFNTFDMEKVFGMSREEFWIEFDKDVDFWADLKPYPWYQDLFNYLSKLGEVTISTTPSKNPKCAQQKTEWVEKYLGLNNEHLMIGKRKYLMANPNTILVDDYPRNIEEFKKAGGRTCLVSSNWNTQNLSFNKIIEEIEKQIK